MVNEFDPTLKNAENKYLVDRKTLNRLVIVSEYEY